MLTKFLNPKNDLAFKRIFGTEKNKDILIHFLNDIFGRTTNPIEDVTFLKPAQEPEVAAQRVSVVDVLCEDSIGNRFIIEMQVGREGGFEKRAQYYAAKTYIEQREKNIKFKDLKSVIFLAITNFNLFSQKEGYLSHHMMLDKETLTQDLKDFSFSFLELPKFNKTKNQLKTMTEKWAYFFKKAQDTTEEELSLIVGTDIIIEKAYEELNRFSWSAEELRSYDSIDMKKAADEAILEQAVEQAKADGKIEGEIKGKREEKIFIAKNLLVLNVSLQDIASATGLSEAEIKLIK